MIDHSETLGRRLQEAWLSAGVLLVSVFIAPFVIYLWFSPEDIEPAPSVEQVLSVEQSPSGERDLSVGQGLLATFLVIIAWLLVQGGDVGKAFLGGLAFKTLTATQNSIQVGDRITVKGHSGKVEKIGVFYLKLQTLDDDLVSIPTSGLWSELLVSANAGERSSLCVMEFELMPYVSRKMRQAAEDAIWDAMQASVYCNVGKPMQIYLSQKSTSICLTAKAYVNATYDEPHFKSDVTRAFLDFASDKGIALAGSRLLVENYYRFSKGPSSSPRRIQRRPTVRHT